jgi:3-oxoacyl-[acyl-carrier protein] reductase
VVVNYASSRPGAGGVVKRTTEKGGKAIAVQGNVSLVDEIQRLFGETKEAYGKLDILVNNAGIYEFAPLEATTPEQIQKQFNLDVVGLIFATQEAVPQSLSGGAWPLLFNTSVDIATRDVCTTPTDPRAQ